MRARSMSLVVTLVAPVTACGGDGALGCGDAVWNEGSGAPEVDFVMACSGMMNVNMSGMGYDQFGRSLGYTFSFACGDAAPTVTGSVTNIEYNEWGYAMSWNYSVNGQACGRVTRNQ